MFNLWLIQGKQVRKYVLIQLNFAVAYSLINILSTSLISAANEKFLQTRQQIIITFTAVSKHVSIPIPNKKSSQVNNCKNKQ